MDATKDLLYLILILIVLFILWIFTGGPGRYQNSKPFIGQPGVDTPSTQYGPN